MRNQSVIEGNITTYGNLFESGKERRRNMSEMLEKILSDDNIENAYKRVYANKGAGGIDGVTINELEKYKCQYMNEQKIKNKNVQKCELCN